VAEAARNVAASGARPIAATNCLNFGSPEKPEVMWQFSQAIEGIGEACTALGTPITGGNVSFYNETLGKSIYPTPVIGVLGILDDASRVVKIAFRNTGDVIVLLDGADPSEKARHIGPLPAQEFSSSEYSKTVAELCRANRRHWICLPKKIARLFGGLSERCAGKFRSRYFRWRTRDYACRIVLRLFSWGDLYHRRRFLSRSFTFGERGARCLVSVAPASLPRCKRVRDNTASLPAK
jgi:hypothetical protein